VRDNCTWPTSLKVIQATKTSGVYIMETAPFLGALAKNLVDNTSDSPESRAPLALPMLVGCGPKHYAYVVS